MNPGDLTWVEFPLRGGHVQQDAALALVVVDIEREEVAHWID